MLLVLMLSFLWVIIIFCLLVFTLIYVNENFRINNGGERVIIVNLSKRKWLGVDGMLAERLFIYGRQLNSLHDCLFDGLRFFA